MKHSLKKVLSVILVVCMITSSIPITSIFAGAASSTGSLGEDVLKVFSDIPAGIEVSAEYDNNEIIIDYLDDYSECGNIWGYNSSYGYITLTTGSIDSAYYSKITYNIKTDNDVTLKFQFGMGFKDTSSKDNFTFEIDGNPFDYNGKAEALYCVTKSGVKKADVWDSKTQIFEYNLTKGEHKLSLNYICASKPFIYLANMEFVKGEEPVSSDVTTYFVPDSGISAEYKIGDGEYQTLGSSITAPVGSEVTVQASYTDTDKLEFGGFYLGDTLVEAGKTFEFTVDEEKTYSIKTKSTIIASSGLNKFDEGIVYAPGGKWSYSENTFSANESGRLIFRPGTAGIVHLLCTGDLTLPESAEVYNLTDGQKLETFPCASSTDYEITNNGSATIKELSCFNTLSSASINYLKYDSSMGSVNVYGGLGNTASLPGNDKQITFYSASGNTVALVATPSDKNSFDGWYLNNGATLASKDNPYVIKLSSGTTYTAKFAGPATVSTSVEKSMWGSVSGAGDYKLGSTCTLTATPKTDCEVEGWYVDGAKVGTGNTYSFTVEKATSVTVRFQKPGYYILTVKYNESQGIVKDVLKDVIPNGEEIERNVTGTAYLYAEPLEGYAFEGWYIGDNLISTKADGYGLTGYSADTTVEGRFAKISKLTFKYDSKLFMYPERTNNIRVWVYDSNGNDITTKISGTSNLYDILDGSTHIVPKDGYIKLYYNDDEFLGLNTYYTFDGFYAGGTKITETSVESNKTYYIYRPAASCTVEFKVKEFKAVSGYSPDESLTAVENRLDTQWSASGGVLTGTAVNKNYSLSPLKIVPKENGLLKLEYKISSTGSGNAMLYYSSSEITDRAKSGVTELELKSDWTSFSLPVTAGTPVYFAFFGIISGANNAMIRNLTVNSGSSDVTFTCPDGTGDVKVNGVSVLGKTNTYYVGDKVTVTAAPKSGCQFYCWQVNGTPVSTDTSYSFIISEKNKPLTVNALYATTGYYKASIGMKYYTKLTDALNAAVSGNVVKLIDNVTLEESATVKSGVILVVPSSDKAMYSNAPLSSYITPWGTSSSTASVLRTLTIPSGMTLTVNGKLLVDAEVGKSGVSGFTGITGSYGKISLAGNIALASGSEFYCAGITEGTGSVTASSGAAVYETYYADRFRGTSDALYRYNSFKIFPFNEGKSNSVRTALTVNSGASLTGRIKIYNSDSTITNSNFCIVGSTGLVKLASGASCVRTIDSSLVESYVFTGDASFGKTSFSLNGTTIQTDMGMGNWFISTGDRKIELKDGRFAFTNKLEFLPGATFTVTNSKVEILNGGGLLFAESGYYSHENKYPTTGNRYPSKSDCVVTFDENSVIVVNEGGSLAAKSMTGGGIVSTMDGAFTTVTTLVPVSGSSTENYTLGLNVNGIQYDGLALDAENHNYAKVSWSSNKPSAVTYTNDWTKDKAKTVLESISVLLDAAGIVSDDSKLSDKVFKLVFSNKTLSFLFDLLGTVSTKVSAKLSTASAILSFLGYDLEQKFKDIGMDVSGWQNLKSYPLLKCTNGEWYYNNKKFDGSKEMFIDIVCYGMSGVSGLIGYILNGNNIGFLGSTYYGYHAYSSTVAYLLEAFGVENAMTMSQYEAAYKSKPLDGFRYILTSIINQAESDINSFKIIDKLPTLAYFVESGGINTVISNFIDPLVPIVKDASMTKNDIYSYLGSALNSMLSGTTVDAKNLNTAAVCKLLDAFLTKLGITGAATPLTSIVTALADSAKASYKTGAIAHNNDFMVVTLDSADILTVVLNNGLNLVKTNAATIGDMLGISDFANILDGVLTAKTPKVYDPNWDVFAGKDKTTGTYSDAWTKDVAKFVAGNIDTVALDLLKVMDEDITSVSKLIGNLSTFVYNDKRINDIIVILKAVVTLVGDSDMLSLLGTLVDCDYLSSILEYDENGVYDIPKATSPRAAFTAKVMEVLEPVYGLLTFMLLGDDFKFLNNDTITVKGANAYSDGIIPLLEAMGCSASAISGLDTVIANVNAGKAEPEVFLEALINVVLDRFDQILTLDLSTLMLNVIPNLLYFVNADGLTVIFQDVLATLGADKNASGNTLMSSFEKLTGKEKIFTGKFTYGDKTLDLTDFSFKDIVVILGKDIGIELSTAFDTFLHNFNVGTKTAYTSHNGKTCYKIVVSADELPDILTASAPALIELLNYKDKNGVLVNAKAVDKLAGIDGLCLKLISEGILNGVATTDYKTAAKPDYYKTTEIDGSEFLTYGNNWTKEKAAYYAEHFDELIAAIAELGGMSEIKLSDFVDIYGDRTMILISNAIQSVFDAVEEIAGEDVLNDLAVLLDCDFDTLKEYVYEAGTVKDEATFKAEIQSLLSPVMRLAEFLLLGKDYKFFSGMQVLGAKGYEKGILPMLTAFGIDVSKIDTTTGEKLVAGLLDAVCTKINSLMFSVKVNGTDAENAAANKAFNDLLSLIPEAVYFINSGNLSACINNIFAGAYTLSDVVKTLTGKEFDLSIIEDTVPTTFSGLLEFVNEELELDLPEFLTADIDSFFFGAIKDGKADYTDKATKADMLTIILSVLLQTALNGDSPKALDTLLGTDGLVQALVESKLLSGLEYSYFKPSKAEYYKTAEIKNKYLEYDNDWTADDAKYIDANLSDILSDILAIAGKDSLGLADIVNIYNDKTVNTIGTLLANVVSKITAILGTKGTKTFSKLLDCDLSAIAGYTEKTYNIETEADFKKAVAEVLAPTERLIEFLLLESGYKFFYDKAEKDYIVVPGAKGYTEGFVPLLSAFGITAPAKYDNGKALVSGVLDLICGKLDAVLGDETLASLLDLLPEVIYFINSGEFEAYFKNVFAGAYTLADALKTITGDEIDLSMINDVAGLKLSTLLTPSKEGDKTNAVIDTLKGYLGGLTFSSDVISGIDSFFFGEIKNGKAVYSTADTRADMLTIIVSVLLETANISGNAEKIDTLLGTDGLVKKLTSLDAFKGVAINVAQADNKEYVNTADKAEKYLKYDTDWNREKALYFDKNLNGLVTALENAVGKKLDLSVLTNTVYADTVVNETSKILKDVVTLISEKADLTLVSKLLGCDLDEVLKYEATESTITDAATFKTAMAKVLAPVENLIEFLLLKDGYEFFNDFGGKDLIKLSGAQGYLYGIKPILDALGADTSKIDTTTGNKLVAGVLDALCARLDAIVADPVNEILGMLPEVIYFVNSGEFRASFKNILGAVDVLDEAIEAITGEGIDLSMTDALTTFKLSDIVKLIEDNTGIKIPKGIANKLDNFFIGKLDKDGKAVYAKQPLMAVKSPLKATNVIGDRADMITIVLSVLLEIAEYEDNAEIIDELLGTDGAVAKLIGSDLLKGIDVDSYYEEPANPDYYKAYELKDNKYLSYTNDWTKEYAEYFAENIDETIGTLAGLAGLESDISGLLDIYNDDTVNAVGNLIKTVAETLTADMDETVIGLVSTLLDIDLEKALSFEETEGKITDEDSFKAAMSDVIEPVGRLLSFLLLSDEYNFFTKSEEGEAVIINGAKGYEKGLRPILKALGIAPVEGATFDVVNKGMDLVAAVLDGVCEMISDDKPVALVLSLIPEIVYFFNSGAFEASFNNMFTAAYALADELEEITGVEIDLSKISDLAETKLSDILDIIAEYLGVSFSEYLNGDIDSFFIGKLSEDTGLAEYADGKGTSADMVTILLGIVLETVLNNDIAGSSKLEALKALANNTPTYENENGTAYAPYYTAEEYVQYNNDWTKAKAEDLAKSMNEVVAVVEKLAGTGIGLKKLVDEKLYTADIVSMVANAINSVANEIVTKLSDDSSDEAIESACALISNLTGCDFGAVMDDDYLNISVTDGASFKSELKRVLAPVARIAALLLLDDGYTFLETLGDDKIVINGAKGYEKGIAPILTVLGIETANYDNGTALINGLIDTLCGTADTYAAYTDAQLAEKVLDLIPGVVYFINSGAFKASVHNILAGAYSLKSGISELTGMNIDLSAAEDIAAKKLSDILGLIGDKLTVEGTVEDKLDKLYLEGYDKADLLTIILSVAVDTVLYEDNAEKIDTLLGTDGLVKKLVSSKLLKGITVNYTEADNAGYTPVSENKYLEYDNDWTEEKAQYIEANLNKVIEDVLKLAGADISLDLTDILKDKLYTQEIVNKVDEVLKSVVGIVAEKVNATELNAISETLDIDLNAVLTAEVPEVKDEATFKTALETLLAPVERIVELFFLDDGYEFLYDVTGADQIIVNGAKGYEKGIAPVLTALGIEAGEYTTGNALVKGLLDTVCAKLDAVAADPVNEALTLLPEIIYFINSGSFKAAVTNTAAGIKALLDEINKVVTVDLDLSITDDIADIKLSDLLKLAEEKLALDINDTAIENIDSFFFGEMKNGKAVYSKDDSRADMLTIIVSLAVETAMTGDNAEAIDKLIGKDGFVKSILSLDILNGKTAEYKTADNYDYVSGAENASEYLTYSNNWTRATAEYVTDNLDAILDMIVSATGKEIDISGLIDIYSDETVNKVAMLLQSVVAKIADSVGAEGLKVVSKLLDCDLAKVLAYTEKTYGVKDSATFIAAIENVVEPVDRLVSFLLLNNDYRFLNDFTGEDEIVVTGAEGYKYGIAPMFKALGISAEDEATFAEDGGKLIADLLTKVCGLLDSVLEDPSLILDIAPELIYFVNSGEFKAYVLNTFAGAYSLADAVKLLTGKELGLDSIEEIASLKLSDIAKLAEEKTGIDIDDETVAALDNFFFGEISEGKAVYSEDNSKADLITVVMSVLLETLKNKDNAAALKSFLGEKAYSVLWDVLNLKISSMNEISWLHTEDADTDKVFSGLDSSDFFGGDVYGMVFTEKMAKYISDNLPGFIDMVIRLLGIEISGNPATSLEGLIEGIAETELYTDATVNKLYSFVQKAVGEINSLPGAAHIKNVLKTSLGVDLSIYDTYKVKTLENGTREEFTEALCDMFRPLYPILKWVLCEEDLKFFNGKSGDLVVLPGGQGYNYGIIPMLEALFCDNIKTANEYYADIAANEDAILLDIFNALFDKVDYILEDPANRIFDILPNIAYFINSNGLDTCFKNLINPLLTLAKALEPVIGQIDIYEILGVSLETIDFQKVMAFVIDFITEGTNIDLSILPLDAVAALTTGKIVSYTSLNGRKSYRMVYDEESSSRTDAVTIVLVLVAKYVTNENNAESIKQLIKAKVSMSDSAYKFTCTIIDLAGIYCSTKLGMETILAAVYYVFKAVNTGVVSLDESLNTTNGRINLVFKTLEASDNSVVAALAKTFASLLDNNAGDVVTEEGVAPNGFIAFIRKIIDFFKKMIAFIKGLFH